MKQAILRCLCAVMVIYTFLGVPAMGQVRNEQAWSNFYEAVEQGELDKVREFLKKNPSAATAFASSGETALHLAAKNDDTDIVKLLLAAGANPNARSTHAMGQTPLHISSQRGDSASRISVLPMLIAAGGKVNLADTRDGSTPLHCALADGNLINASILLRSKADPNFPNLLRRTPLFEAMHKDSIRRPAIQLLLSAGANPNWRDSDDKTPLHSAAFYGDEASVQMLFSANADPNVAGKDGETALHIAAKQDHMRLVGVFLARMKPAAISARDREGQTALGKAAYTGNAELIALLIQYGLKPEIEQLVVLLNRGAHAAARRLTYLHPRLVPTLRSNMEAEYAKVFPQYVSDGMSRNAFQVHALLFLDQRDEALKRLKAFDQTACGAATPLMDAVIRKDLEAARILLELGANPNAQVAEPLRALFTGPGPMSSSGISRIAFEFPPPCSPIQWQGYTGKSKEGSENTRQTTQIDKPAFGRLIDSGQIFAPTVSLSMKQIRAGAGSVGRSGQSHFFGSALLISVRQKDLPMAKLLLQFGADPKLASLVPPSESAQSIWLSSGNELPDADQWRVALRISPQKPKR